MIYYKNPWLTLNANEDIENNFSCRLVTGGIVIFLPNCKLGTVRFVSTVLQERTGC